MDKSFLSQDDQANQTFTLPFLLGIVPLELLPMFRV